MRRGRLRVVAVLAILVAASAAYVAPAFAGGESWAFTDDNGIGAVAGTGGPSSGSGRGGSGATVTCTYRHLSDGDAAIAQHMADTGSGPTGGSGPGAWYVKSCDDPDGFSSMTVIWIPARDPRALAEQALSYTPLTAPEVRLSPTGDQLVNVTTWLWVDAGLWRTETATASVPGLSVTTTATPLRVVWDLGDGHSVVCASPGTPYDASKPVGAQHTDCSYTYQRGSAGQPDNRFVVTATFERRATWVATSGETGDLGIVRRSASVPVRVAEAQALNQ